MLTFQNMCAQNMRIQNSFLTEKAYNKRLLKRKVKSRLYLQDFLKLFKVDKI